LAGGPLMEDGAGARANLIREGGAGGGAVRACERDGGGGGGRVAATVAEKATEYPSILVVHEGVIAGVSGFAEGGEALMSVAISRCLYCCIHMGDELGMALRGGGAVGSREVRDCDTQ
jgi:hypothetical protein